MNTFAGVGRSVYSFACLHRYTQLCLKSQLSMASLSTASNKPYVYQVFQIHPELQRMLDTSFHVVWEKEVDKYRDKVSAIFVHVAPLVTEEVIRSFPKLKVIGNCAVGYDNVDTKACKTHGVRIGYTPGVLSDTTADMGFALLLAVARRVIEGDKIMKSPDTTHIDQGWFGLQVSSMTCGIVGMGRIGSEVAKRARGFNMKILYHNRHQKPKEVEEELQATYVPSLEQLLSQSDHVILVAPASKETYHMMGRAQFSAMKKTAVFVNIARGSLVDQDALHEALQLGTIAGAGLDVTDPEPLPRDHPLLSLPNIVITPHSGSATLHTRKKMIQLTIDNIMAGIKGEPMPRELIID